MIQLRRSLFITFFSTNAMTVVQFGVTLVLARLLTPSEVGIFSITSVAIGLAAVVRDFGVSSYLQSEKDLTPAKLRAAMGLMITSCWLLAAVIYACSDILAAYYGQPGIGSVMRVLTISFVLIPFASFYYSLLSRELNAGKQAMVNAFGTLVYAATCITLAYRGHSYMSLAWANVANILSSLLAYMAVGPKGISLRPSLRGWREPMSFGSGAILNNLTNHFYTSIPDLVLGKLSGPHNVGLYSRANGLVSIFQQIVGPTVNYTALPYISANHHANVQLAPILSKATSYLTGFALPAYAVTAVFAEEIIRVLYGAQWAEAAPLVAVLCLSFSVRVGYALGSNALTAIGRPHLAGMPALAGAVLRCLLIWLLGARDIMTFAIALLIADMLASPVVALLMSRYLHYTIPQSLRAHGCSVLLAALCAALALALKAALPAGWPHMARVALLGAIMAPAWVAGILVLRHPLRDELLMVLGKVMPRVCAGVPAK